MTARVLIPRLRAMGYELGLEGDNIRLHWQPEDDPDPAQVDDLLMALKANRHTVVAALRAEQATMSDSVSEGQTAPSEAQYLFINSSLVFHKDRPRLYPFSIWLSKGSWQCSSWAGTASEAIVVYGSTPYLAYQAFLEEEQKRKTVP